MKITALVLGACCALVSCSKNSSNGSSPTPQPVVDNGPIGGTYNFTSSTTKTYDTIPGNGIVTITEYTTTGTNYKGSAVVSASTITSKGLTFDYSTTGTKKEVNTSNNATTTTNVSMPSGSSGSTTSSFNSNYSISTSSGELTVTDAQYLFHPAFISQPSDKKHKYTVSGSVLKIITESYNASAKNRVVNESTFTKQ